MRKRNWSKYNKHLVQQGSISFLIDPKIFKTLRKTIRSKRPGRPTEFSDALIQILLMIKIRFRLPYRALEGFAKNLFKNKGRSIPTYSLVCKRVSRLRLTLPKPTTDRPLVVILDASGTKICGEGEWKGKA